MEVRPRTIEIAPLEQAEIDLWGTVARIAGHLGPDRQWCLVGGLMVQLHAYEHSATPRPTRDIDLLGDARKQPSVTTLLGEAVEELGGELADPPSTDPKLGYRFVLDGQVVDILGSDGLRTPGITVGNRETIEVPGGSQALNRSEVVAIAVGGATPVLIRRPSLLGSILIKARALLVHDRWDDQRRDLILLLTFVEDPRALAGELRSSEVRWLREASARLDLDDPSLEREFTGAALRDATGALDLLTR